MEDEPAPKRTKGAKRGPLVQTSKDQKTYIKQWKSIHNQTLAPKYPFRNFAEKGPNKSSAEVKNDIKINPKSTSFRDLNRAEIIQKTIEKHPKAKPALIRNGKRVQTQGLLNNYLSFERVGRELRESGDSFERSRRGVRELCESRDSFERVGRELTESGDSFGLVGSNNSTQNSSCINSDNLHGSFATALFL